MCHSDDHVATGDLPIGGGLMCGGHEGAGIVEQVGPHTPDWNVGDRVILSFLPACGHCRWCASGMQNLCDNGANTLAGIRMDGSYRMHLDGMPVGQMAGISTFSQYTTVSTMSAIPCPDDIPLDVACLTSCGVGTGWGSAVNSAEVRAGDVVIVMGVGGIGINAVQGAAHAGASVLIAVDPVEMKREMALQARRHPCRRHHGRGHRDRPQLHQRAGRRLRASSASASRPASTSPKASTRSARAAPACSPVWAT